MAWDPRNCGVHDSFGLVCHYESKTKNYFRLYFCIEAQCYLGLRSKQTTSQMWGTKGKGLPKIGQKVIFYYLVK